MNHDIMFELTQWDSKKNKKNLDNWTIDNDPEDFFKRKIQNETF